MLYKTASSHVYALEDVCQYSLQLKNDRFDGERQLFSNIVDVTVYANIGNWNGSIIK